MLSFFREVEKKSNFFVEMLENCKNLAEKCKFFEEKEGFSLKKHNFSEKCARISEKCEKIEVFRGKMWENWKN